MTGADFASTFALKSESRINPVERHPVPEFFLDFTCICGLAVDLRAGPPTSTEPHALPDHSGASIVE